MKKVEIHLKNPNECEHNVEVGCIKDVCDCYTLVSSEEELLKSIEFVLSAGNRAQAIRMIEQYGHWKQEGLYSAEDMRNTYSIGWITRERFDDLVYPKGLDYEEKQDYSFEQWFKNYKK